MSTSPLISSSALNNPNVEETATTNKPELSDNPPLQEGLSLGETKPSVDVIMNEVPIHHHHEHHDQPVSTGQTQQSGVGSSSSSTITPTTTMVSVVVDESEEDKDLLRSDFGHKGFYHLHALNDDSLSNYCKNYGESTEGNKYAKLARLLTHFPNFNRKGMERFTLEGLKEMCLELGLSTEGKKAILIDRLFNLYVDKHKDDKVEFTFDTSATTEDVHVHHTLEEEEEEVNPKTGEPFRKSPRVANKRKQTEKDSITREYFMKHAEDLKFIVDGKEHVASKKSETHNSFGWHYSGRSKIEIGSHSVPITYTFNATVNKSGRKEEVSDDEE